MTTFVPIDQTSQYVKLDMTHGGADSVLALQLSDNVFKRELRGENCIPGQCSDVRYV